MTQNSIVKEKVLVGAFSVITNLRIDLRFKLYSLHRGNICTFRARQNRHLDRAGY